LSQCVTEDFMAPIPMRRGASPAEISTFVLFLVSDESSYATGASSLSTAD
jgi:3alpha(or 20beta)-hydroxysteroid dehydrogenase